MDKPHTLLKRTEVLECAGRPHEIEPYQIGWDRVHIDGSERDKAAERCGIAESPRVQGGQTFRVLTRVNPSSQLGARSVHVCSHDCAAVAGKERGQRLLSDSKPQTFTLRCEQPKFEKRLGDVAILPLLSVESGNFSYPRTPIPVLRGLELILRTQTGFQQGTPLPRIKSLTLPLNASAVAIA